MTTTNTNTNKNFQDLWYTIVFKDGSTWTDKFVRETILNDKLGIVATNKFKNDFLDGADAMTKTTIKGKFKLWLISRGIIKDVVSVKWELA